MSGGEKLVWLLLLFSRCAVGRVAAQLAVDDENDVFAASEWRQRPNPNNFTEDDGAQDRRKLYLARLGREYNGSAVKRIMTAQQQLSPTEPEAIGASKPITIRVVAGMGNRIRQILGAYFYCTEVAQVPLIVVWVPDAFCNAHWNDLFEDIEGISVIPEGVANRAKRGGLFKIIEQWLRSDRRHRLPAGWKRDPRTHEYHTPPGLSANTISKRLYSLLRPCAALRRHIQQYVLQNNVAVNAVAVHARRTDQMGGNKVTTNEEFFEWIEERTAEARQVRARAGEDARALGEIKVFLATDNKKTREEFKQKYGDRLLVFGDISDQSDTKVRVTPVTNAVCDIFIASYAVEYRGTTGTIRGSSFSAMIYQIWKGRPMHDGYRTCSAKRVNTACHHGGGRGWDRGPVSLETISGESKASMSMDMKKLKALPPPPPPPQ